MAIVQLAIAILATYRLARLLPEDDGPFFVFTRIRNFAKYKAILSYCEINSEEDEHVKIVFEPHEVTPDMLLSNDNKDLGVWSNLYKGINCPFCCGLYAAVLVALLVLWQNYYGNVILLIFAIAGGQSLLQKWSDG